LSRQYIKCFFRRVTKNAWNIIPIVGPHAVMLARVMLLTVLHPRIRDGDDININNKWYELIDKIHRKNNWNWNSNRLEYIQ